MFSFLFFFFVVSFPQIGIILCSQFSVQIQSMSAIDTTSTFENNKKKSPLFCLNRSDKICVHSVSILYTNSYN